MSSLKLWGSFPKDIRNEHTFMGLRETLTAEMGVSEWPHIKCHGDLWSRNILLTVHDYYIIDWEHSDRYLFFYDVFHCMATEALWRDDYSMEDVPIPVEIEVAVPGPVMA